jgi:hypothetical protein
VDALDGDNFDGATADAAQPSQANRRGGAGGAAMASGQRFQAQVTAWWSARVLLQTAIGQAYGLPAISVAERIYCETSDSIDDIRIELSADGKIFGQCKTGLSLSTGEDSEWASVLSEFYGELERPCRQGINRRFVLFYERHNGNLRKLKTILDRYRQLPAGTPIIDAAKPDSEIDIVNDLNRLLDLLQARPEFSNLVTKREDLLRHTYIRQLRLAAGDPDYLGVADALQDGLLREPTQVTTALNSLHRLADDLLADRGSTDRPLLRTRLQGEGIALRETVGFRSDFEKLENWSITELASHEAEGRTKLAIGNDFVTIPRPVVAAMFDAALIGSYIVAGGAGSGKTGCLVDLTNRLRAAGLRVWYWSADSLPGHSAPEMAVHLRLEHPWPGLLAEAATGTTTAIVIDGLDALRDARAQVAYRKLFAIAIRSGVRVIASIRLFDLQYAADLQELFLRTDLQVPPQFVSPALRKLNHVFVPELTPDEFITILAKLPQVLPVLLTAPQLIPLVFNLFSLDLLCQLITDGEGGEALSSISTQAELFERYWAKRVKAHELREEMTIALAGLIEKMTTSRSLQVVPEPWSGEVKSALFSAGLVRHPASAPGRLVEEKLIEFNHHLLFDYAAELLFVRPRRDHLAQELIVVDTWGLFLRQSLLLFHLYVWNNGRADFWDILIGLEKGAVSVLHKLPGHMAIAELANSRQDLQPLLDGGLSAGESQFWLQTLRGVVSAASFTSLPKLFNAGRGEWWLEFAKDLVLTGMPGLVHEGQWLMSTASRFATNLSPDGRLIFNQTAIALQRHFSQAEMEPSIALRFAIEWICLTGESDRRASGEVLRKALSLEQLQDFGYIQAYAIADQIDKIWALDPALALEAYDAIFGYVETEKKAVALNSSRILHLTAELKQEYEMAYHLLAWKFLAFMTALPSEATKAMVRVTRHYRDQEHPVINTMSIKSFAWNGRRCGYQPDHSALWDAHDYDEQQKISRTWESGVASLPSEDNPDAKWAEISEALIAENEVAALWSRLLIGAARAPAFYAPRLYTLLTEPAILAEDDTEQSARDCILSFAQYLDDVELGRIEEAILNLRCGDVPYDDDAYAERKLEHLKIKFLLAIPENRRGSVVKEFLSHCDPELLNLFKPRTETGDIDSSILFDELNQPNDASPGISSAERELLNASAPVMHITAREITNDSLPSILESIQRIEERLSEDRDNLAAQVVEKVENRILHALSIIASSDTRRSSELTQRLFGRFRDVLRTHQFESSAASDPFNPYFMATDGLLALVKQDDSAPSADCLQLLRQVADHPESKVQQHFAAQLWSLFTNQPEFVWNTLEGWVRALPSRAELANVLKIVLRDNWFWFLRRNNLDRADDLLMVLWSGAHAQGDTALRSKCGGQVSALSILKEEEWTKPLLKTALNSAEAYLAEIWGVVEFTDFGLFPTKEEKSTLTLVQKNGASQLLVELLRSIKVASDAYFDDINLMPVSERPSDNPAWITQVARMFSRISGKIRFAAEDRSRELAEMEGGVRDTELSDWWGYTEPVLEALLSIPHPSFAFNLVEGLERLVEFDFCRVLHWISKATLASAPAGFAGESLASGRVVGILERTLAEHRVSLVEDAELRSDFLQTLEAFLAVGHPGAISLAIQFEGIFR